MQNPDLKAYPASIYRCLALLLTATLALAACGGGGSDDGAPTYAVGGSVTGLIAGESVVMQENGGNNTPVSVNASFSFNTRLATGADYAVTVLTQPTGEICTVRNGSGTVGAANISVAVTCVPNSYTVGGTVVGLVPGNNIVLADNGGNSISVSANTSFTFATALLSGSAYAVTVSTQPTGQSCSVTNGSGTLSGANISNVSVSCATLSYNVGVTVFGLLANTSIVLQDNGGDTLTVSNTGAFTFKTQLQYGTAYAVTVATQPASQTCYAPSNGSGSVGAADVSVTIVCPWHVMYAANFAGGSIVAYYIDPTSGGLLAFPNSGAAASGLTFPMNIAVTPNQKYLYVSESADPGFIAGFAINPTTGALTSIAGSPFAAGTAPRSVTIDSSGGFLYAANISIYCDNSFCGYPPTSISAYRINAETGGLTPLAGSPYTTATSPSPAVADTTANYLFTPLGTYTIDPTTGALSLTSTAPAIGCSNNDISPSQQPCAAAISQNGAYLYTGYSGLLSAYTIDSSNGTLAPASGSPYSASVEDSPSSITVTPDGKFVYAAGGAGYSVNSLTGLLTPLVALSALSGGVLGIDPSGQFMYLTGQSPNWVSGFMINSNTGALSTVSGSPFSGPSGVAFNSFSVAIVPLP